VSVAAIVKGKDDIVVGGLASIGVGGFYVRLQRCISTTAGEMVTVNIYLNESGQSNKSLPCMTDPSG
jgi:hypothetical protein